MEMIATRRDSLDVKLLLFALKKSTEFEQWLVLRFPSREYEEIKSVRFRTPTFIPRQIAWVRSAFT
jgi:hypothetical protein